MLRGKQLPMLYLLLLALATDDIGESETQIYNYIIVRTYRWLFRLSLEKTSSCLPPPHPPLLALVQKVRLRRKYALRLSVDNSSSTSENEATGFMVPSSI